ncbi:hypothetical protein BD560DRAFT_331116, partial [Blakeslea trispora]
MIEVEHTVLASTDYSPVRLFYFHGSEEEDFLELADALDEYFGTRRMKDDYQKLSYLRTLLKGIAKINFCKRYTSLENLKYDEVMAAMKNQYASSKSKLRKIEAFEETFQQPGESPANFFVRVSETAAKAGIEETSAIHRRFRYGLLPVYFKHCQALGAESHAEYYKYAQG